MSDCEDKSKTYTERYECAESQRETDHELSVQIARLCLVIPTLSSIVILGVIGKDCE